MRGLIVLLALIALSAGVKLPPNFQKCNRKAPLFKECTLKAAQDGIIQLGKSSDGPNLPNVNPLEVKEMTVGGTNGPVAVQQKFKNCKLYGIERATFQKFEFDFDKKTLDIVATVPEIKKTCDYEMKGQILVIPINGQGKSTIVLKNVAVTDRLKFAETKRRSKTYVKFLPDTFSLDPELVTFDFVNAFDKRLSDRINPVLNDNWKVVFDDVKGDYSEAFGQIFASIVNRFFTELSMEEAFDDSN